MSNTFGVFMSYCRYDGTKRALAECLGDVQEKLEKNTFGEEFTPKSKSEVEAFEYMVENFVDWLHDNCLLDEYGSLNHSELENICKVLEGEMY